jgi:hypothetical protein
LITSVLILYQFKGAEVYPQEKASARAISEIAGLVIDHSNSYNWVAFGGN